MGSESRGEKFFQQYWPSASAIGDPKQFIYRGFGIGIGSFRQFFRPAIYNAFLREWKYGVGLPSGNTMRNPGAVLIQGESILYAQEFEHFGVQVDVETILNSIESVTLS